MPMTSIRASSWSSATPAAPIPGERVTLRDGRQLLIGRVTPRDAPVLADGFARLSEESRRLRFLTAKPTLSRSELRYLTEVDGHHHEALGAVDPQTGEGVGIARFVRDSENPTRAEAAITVADAWQRHGVGKLLLERLSNRAREEGITHFTALVSGDNRGMQALISALGYPAHISPIRGGTSLYEVELGPTGLARQLEQALRAAASGHFRLPPRLWETLRSLVPLRLGR
jgi:GNAT superfamily N-acetyltransferase